MSKPAVRPSRRRWAMLAVGQSAVTAGCAFQFGLPYLVPALREEGLSLFQAGLLVACPMAGLMLTLIVWGVVADRWGERRTLGLGLSVAGLALLGSSSVTDPLPLGACLMVAGAGGASVHAASGRLILGWFGARERGLAMGIRQAAHPLGVAVAAVTLPPLGHSGPAAPLVFLAVLCLGTAAFAVLLVRDPVRPEPPSKAPSEPPSKSRREAGPEPGAQAGARPGPEAGPEAGREPGTVASPRDHPRVHTGTPYRTPVLWRIHLTSGLMVVPQFAIATFALVYLVDVEGWEASCGGRVLAAGALGGALVRLAVGAWSDRAGSRLRPFRTLTVLIAVVMSALAAGAYSRSPAVIPVLLSAMVITVSPNGLAFTAVAEYAGNAWAGRALGIQNTVQNAFAVATPPLLGLVVTGFGYSAAFGAVIAFPLIAVATVPVRGERPHS